MLKLMAITNDPEYWKKLSDAGVDRLLIDLEILGKVERQAGRDTVISGHDITDLEVMRSIFPSSDIVVRLNPLNERSLEEIESCIPFEPNHFMLPMFTELDQVEQIASLIDGRANLIPLVETLGALESLQDLEQFPTGVSELFFGLNDLHLEMKHSFMFQALLDQRLQIGLRSSRQLGSIGFGGIAPLNAGLISGRHVLAFHAAYDSECVILSRFFKDSVADAELSKEVYRLKKVYAELKDSPQVVRRLVAEGVQLISEMGKGDP